MIGAALALAHKGLAIFPCLPKDKKPATRHGCKDATTDPDAILQWWCHEPRYNIAIATGQPSGIFVIDIDGLDAECELRKLEAKHGALPATVEAITARGRHAYFKVAGKCQCAIRPPRSAPASMCAATAATCWRRRACTRAAAATAGASTAPDAFAAAPDWLLDKISRAHQR